MLLYLSTNELIFMTKIRAGNSINMWPSNPKEQRWWTEHWGFKLL